LPSPALVEKDWYVVQAIAAITTIAASPFQLVFNGGTALSRAYRLIGRMSEDIDLKIITDYAIAVDMVLALAKRIKTVKARTG
jgi:predicted nucleotidyltransferase component of viral defense system